MRIVWVIGQAIFLILAICPLVPVPPHGRLIDADALTQQIMMKADATCGWADALDLALAPTIIEAEGGE